MERRPAREGVPSFPRLRERRRLEQEQELQSQDEEEKEDDADEGASYDDSRADASGGSLIGVSHLSSRNNGSNSSHHNARSETVKRVTKRTTVVIKSRRDQPPTFTKLLDYLCQIFVEDYRLHPHYFDGILALHLIS